MPDKFTAWRNEYNAKNYDRISLMVKSGEKEVIKAHADTMKEKVNAFINRAIKETMERDKTKKGQAK
jgi:uncharacterized protein (DUF1778 family)